MGLLDNLALRRAEKNLRPFMRPDERIIEYDVADVAQVGDRIPVVLSNRAVYLVSHPAIRTPYEHILDFEARGRQLIAFTTKSGNAFMIQIIGTPKGDLYDTISHHIDNMTRHREEIDVPGGTVLAVCRPIEEDGDAIWTYLAGENVDLTSSEVQSRIAEKLAPTSQRLGVPLPEQS